MHGFDFPRPTESSQRKITASYVSGAGLPSPYMCSSWDVMVRSGHVVFAAALGLGSSLSPPLRGSWVFSEFMDWMKADNGRVAFIPRFAALYIIYAH